MFLLFRNEGYNSRLQKLIVVTHPNPNILLSKLVDELVLSEAEIERLGVIFFLRTPFKAYIYFFSTEMNQDLLGLKSMWNFQKSVTD